MLLSVAQHRKFNRFSATAWLLAGVVLALAGCQNLPESPANVETADTSAGRARPYYVRVQPEATSLVSVNDDGENTFLEFGILPPGELKLFDSDGKPLRPVWLRNMAILAGTHQGILLRLGTATSYISLHPQADRLRKPPLQENAAIHELRDRLIQEGQRGAMERALSKASALEQTSSAATTSVSTSVKSEHAKIVTEAQVAENRLAREDMERSIERLQSRQLNYGASLSTAGQAAPELSATAVRESTENSWPRSQKVFFASNSVGISAPDDGLHRLLVDARQSDEIWIAGHTDSIGPRDANRALAKRRAEAIKYILTSRGVPADKIVIVRAPGDTYIAGNETEIGRAQNRRVEVTFVRSRGLAAPRAGLGDPLAR